MSQYVIPDFWFNYRLWYFKKSHVFVIIGLLQTVHKHTNLLVPDIFKFLTIFSSCSNNYSRSEDVFVDLKMREPGCFNHWKRNNVCVHLNMGKP